MTLLGACFIWAAAVYAMFCQSQGIPPDGPDFWGCVIAMVVGFLFFIGGMASDSD